MSDMDWMFVSSSNPYVEHLTPNAMVFVGRAFGQYLGLGKVMKVESA